MKEKDHILPPILYFSEYCKNYEGPKKCYYLKECNYYGWCHLVGRRLEVIGNGDGFSYKYKRTAQCLFLVNDGKGAVIF